MLRSILGISCLLLWMCCACFCTAQSRFALGVNGGGTITHAYWRKNKPNDKSQIELYHPSWFTAGVKARYKLNSSYVLIGEVNWVPVTVGKKLHYVDSLMNMRRTHRFIRSFTTHQISLQLSKAFRVFEGLKKYNGFWEVRIGPVFSWRGNIDFNAGSLNAIPQTAPNGETKAPVYTFAGRRGHALLKTSIGHIMRLPNKKLLSVNLSFVKGFTQYFETRITYQGQERYYATTGDHVALYVSYLFQVMKKRQEVDKALY